MSVKITGLKDVTRALESLDRKVVGAGATGPVAFATRKSIKPVQQTAAAKAPIGDIAYTFVGDVADPGRLKRNIKIRRITRPEQYGIRNGEIYEVYVKGSRKKNNDDPNNAWYWHFVEFGTSKQTAQPFLRPALEQHQNTMAFKWIGHFNEKFERIVKKLESESKRASA